MFVIDVKAEITAMPSIYELRSNPYIVICNSIGYFTLVPGAFYP
jgi:hypothetical protein